MKNHATQSQFEELQAQLVTFDEFLQRATRVLEQRDVDYLLIGRQNMVNAIDSLKVEGRVVQLLDKLKPYSGYDLHEHPSYPEQVNHITDDHLDTLIEMIKPPTAELIEAWIDDADPRIYEMCLLMSKVLRHFDWSRSFPPK